MSRFSICSYSIKKDSNDWKILSVFIFPVQFNDNDLDDAIAKFFPVEGPFDAVHFVGYPESIEYLNLNFRSGKSAVIRRIENSINDFNSNLHFVTTDKSGTLCCCDYFGNLSLNETNLNLERRNSLRSIFSAQNGLVTASTGFHFSKPSKKHSDKFLRVSNVLEKSANALQLAFWLCTIIKIRKLRRIIVDTSGIDSVAYALAYESMRRGWFQDFPLIESHKSYEGLVNLDIVDAQETLFLISASTSGGLSAELQSKGAQKENIVTLFYLGEADTALGPVVCDLTRGKEHIDGLNIILNYREQECRYCREHSFALPLSGDQFSTEPIRVDEVEINLADFEKKHRDMLSLLAGTDTFKIFRSLGEREFELYLDIDALLFASNLKSQHAREVRSDFLKKWIKFIRRGIPIHIERMVHTTYPASKEMAKVALQELSKKSIEEHIQVLAPTQLGAVPISENSASLVLSCCFDETHELMGISRDLRTIQPGGNTTYVAPIFRVCSDRERKRIESNLTFGEFGAKTFNLYSVIQIELPTCEVAHSWKLEFEKLRELTHWADMEGIAIPIQITNRISVLQAAPSTGLLDSIFWNAPTDSEMKLSSDFTMIPNEDGKRPVSQADVFAIVTSLYHQYRLGAVPNKPKLAYRSYERAVIAPENFQRFSDGVLQAAFLRAARSLELAYSNCDGSVSRRMLSVLIHEIDAVKNGRGQALMEYIVAIMIGRLTLLRSHQEEFLRCVINELICPDWIRIAAQFCLHQMEIR